MKRIFGGSRKSACRFLNEIGSSKTVCSPRARSAAEDVDGHRFRVAPQVASHAMRQTNLGTLHLTPSSLPAKMLNDLHDPRDTGRADGVPRGEQATARVDRNAPPIPLWRKRFRRSRRECNLPQAPTGSSVPR